MVAQLGRHISRLEDDSRVRLEADTSSGQLHLRANAVDDDGRAQSFRRLRVRVSGPDGFSRDVPLEAAGQEPLMSEITRLGFAARGKISTDTKEEHELFYLFERPLLLDGSKWNRTFGKVPATPYKNGVKATVDWWKDHLSEKPKRKRSKKKRRPKR